MASLRLRVKAEKVVSVEKEDYRDDYVEKCGEDGVEPAEEIPDDFVLSAYSKAIEEGELDLVTELDGGSVDVMLA